MTAKFAKVFLSLMLLMSMIMGTGIKGAEAFSISGPHLEGSYLEVSPHPTTASWSKNSAYSTALTGEPIELLKLEDDTISVNPVIDGDGNIYVSTNNRDLYSLDPNGKINWQVKSEDSIKGMLVQEDGLIYNASGELYKVSLTDGKEIIWKEDYKYNVSSYAHGYVGSPILDDKGNLLALNGYGIIVIDPKSGHILDKVSSPTSSPFNIKSLQVSSNGTIYKYGGGLQTFGFNADNRIEEKDKPTDSNGFRGRYTLLPNNEVAMSSYLLKIWDGKEKNVLDIFQNDSGGQSTLEPTYNVGEDTVLVVSKEPNSLVSFKRDGNIKWEYPNHFVSSPIIDKDGNIVLYENVGGKIHLTVLKPYSTQNLNRVVYSKELPLARYISSGSGSELEPIILKDGGVLATTYDRVYKVEGNAEPTPEPTPEPAPEPTPEPNLVTVFDDANMYDNPTFNDNAKKTVYEYVEKKDGWYKVITAPGHTKWINGDNAIEGDIITDEQVLTLTRDSFGHVSPFHHSDKSGDVLKKDQQVTVKGQIGNWYLTDINGSDVWFNQDASQVHNFVYNQLYDTADTSSPNANGGVAAQDLNLKDLVIKDNGDVWYKIQTWKGDLFIPGDETGFHFVEDMTASYDVDTKIEFYETPFKETPSKTEDTGTLTLTQKWQNWYYADGLGWFQFN